MAESQDTAIKARINKGRDLYAADAVSVHGDLYIVAGSGRNYTVSFDGGDPVCKCKDYKKRRATCKHGYAVIMAAAKGCRPARRKTGHRHKKQNAWGMSNEALSAALAKMDASGGVA